MAQNCWVFVKDEKTPRNVTPLSPATAGWYADTLALELGVQVQVFRHERTRALGRLVSTHEPPGSASMGMGISSPEPSHRTY